MNTRLLVAVLIALVLAPPPGPVAAQGLGDAAMYERWSHQQWHDNYRRLHGEMGPVRRTAHRVRNAYESFDHGVRQFFGDPDLKHYTRHDRRRVGLFGPQSGYLNSWNTRGPIGAYDQFGTNRGMAVRGQALTDPGVSGFVNRRTPTTRDARTGLFW